MGDMGAPVPGQALVASYQAPTGLGPSGFDPSRKALRARAAQRLRLARISMYPPISAPTINREHVDGPCLHRLDASIRWLSWCDRFRLWRGKIDAWALETKYQREEWQEGRMPCLRCDYFPYGIPAHASWCEHRDSDGNPKGGDGTAPSRSDDSAGLQGIAMKSQDKSS